MSLQEHDIKELDEYNKMREKQQSDCINTENIVQ